MPRMLKQAGQWPATALILLLFIFLLLLKVRNVTEKMCGCEILGFFSVFI